LVEGLEGQAFSFIENSEPFSTATEKEAEVEMQKREGK